MKIDENLAAIHSYLCADGYVIKNPTTQKQKYYIIGLRNTNLILLKDFQKRFEKAFNIQPHLDEGQRCRIGSKKIYEELTKNFGSFYSKDWHIPQLSPKLAKIWLRAYFDCEGWVYCKKHQNRMIGAECINEKGLNQVREYLKMCGIFSNIKKKSTRDIFILSIYGKENLIKFQNEIGFLHPDKKEKLNLTIKDFMKYKWEFPKEKEKLNEFVRETIKLKSRIRKDNGIIRMISKEEDNLLRLQKELNRIFDIQSKVNKSINGLGTVYFELDINKHEDVLKIVKNNLLNEKEKEKWKKLKQKG